MIGFHKPVLQVLLQEEDNFCAKCCKTRQIIERMIESVPEIKANIEIDYENIASENVIKKYGTLNPPVILINEKLFSEGHVPIIKKLSRELLKLIELSLCERKK